MFINNMLGGSTRYSYFMKWKTKWVLDESTSPQTGGQGHVRRVRRKSDGVLGALKILHQNHSKNSERRQRMVREVSSLEQLAGSGIPKVLDHNIEDASNKSVEMYLVMEWIDGNTLQNIAGGKPQKIDYSLNIVRRLAEIVIRCHSNGILHRDIKPNNIIIDNESSIYLVDFGLSYFNDPDDELSTIGRQELGNRFLRLPELGAGQSKRDPRSDITFIVGILFFLLTGMAPNSLIDEENRPPHKKPSFFVPTNTKKDHRWKRVLSIFDVGFVVPIDFRFQDASKLIKYIDEAISYSPENETSQPSYLTELDELEALRKSIDATIDEVEQSLIDSLNLLTTSIKSLCLLHNFQPVHPSSKIIKPGKEAKVLWKVCRSDSTEPYVFVGLYALLEGENRSMVSIRLQTESHEKVVPTKEVFYNGPSADLRRLKEEVNKNAEKIFALAIRLLRTKIEKQIS